jgi:hypothetical protein
MALWLLLECAPGLAEPTGKVLFVAGNVTATDPAGNMRALERGGSVDEGDTIATGDGRVQVEFKDGGSFALQPGTRFRVERYRYTGAGDAEDSVLLALLKGGLRTISGLVGKKNQRDYRMDTGVATIGIRGTEYALDLNSSMTGNVADGAIEVCNAAGCLLVQAGHAFFVPSLHQAPVLGERRAFLPPTPRETSIETAPAEHGAGKREHVTGRAPAVSGRKPLPEQRLGSPAKGAGSPNAAFNRLPEPAGPAGMPSESAAAGRDAAQGAPTAPGLMKQQPGATSDLTGPPGLIKKGR